MSGLFVAGWWIRRNSPGGEFRTYAVFALRQVREVHWQILCPINHPPSTAFAVLFCCRMVDSEKLAGGEFRTYAVFALRQVREVHWQILCSTNHPKKVANHLKKPCIRAIIIKTSRKEEKHYEQINSRRHPARKRSRMSQGQEI
ncbi:MAG: hypothetical protein J6S71_09385 [Clostridia bacterium]|nr:hypothetical protein [Clostridia bacterium]